MEENKKLLDFIDRATPILQSEFKKSRLTNECMTLSIQFLRIMYDRHELTGEMVADCKQAILSASIYLANCEGRSPVKE